MIVCDPPTQSVHVLGSARGRLRPGGTRCPVTRAWFAVVLGPAAPNRPPPAQPAKYNRLLEIAATGAVVDWGLPDGFRSLRVLEGFRS